MIINCGIFKTGSTGTYNIIRVALREVYDIVPLGFMVELNRVPNEFIRDNQLVKVHHITTQHRRFLDSKSHKFICTIRDPRGSAFSFYQQYDNINEDALSEIETCWKTTYSMILASDHPTNVLIIQYHDLVNEYIRVIKTILNFIDISYTSKLVDLIHKETNPKNYKTLIVDNLKDLNFDQSTLLHARHIADDLDLEGDGWRSMPVGIKIICMKRFKPILIANGYETEESFDIEMKQLTETEKV